MGCYWSRLLRILGLPYMFACVVGFTQVNQATQNQAACF